MLRVCVESLTYMEPKLLPLIMFYNSIFLIFVSFTASKLIYVYFSLDGVIALIEFLIVSKYFTCLFCVLYASFFFFFLLLVLAL
jgi:hypothetical protein